MVRIQVVISTAVAVAVVLPLASCSSDPAPAEELQPQVTPTVVAPSPTTTDETSLERRARLDQEAAIRAYRVTVGERSRLGVQGTAANSSKLLRSVATGDYLAFITGTLREAKQNGWRLSGRGKIVYAAAHTWSPSSISVKACEDYSRVRVLNQHGEDVTPRGKRRYVQDYTVVKTKGGWKVSTVDSQPVASFQDYGCD